MNTTKEFFYLPESFLTLKQRSTFQKSRFSVT